MDFTEKPIRQSADIQLNLFSWHSEQVAEGWNQLAGFDFDEAEKTLTIVLQQYKEDEEAVYALLLCEKWKMIFEHCDTLNNLEKTSFLFSAWNEFEFLKAWGPQFLRKKLLHRIILLGNENGLFHINDEITMADLYLLDDKPELAEKALQNYFKSNGKSAALQINLANIQWNMGKRKESGVNYLEAFLSSPGEIDSEKIKNETLTTIINKYGAEFTPAWGWIYGQLHLIKFKGFKDADKIKTKGLYQYYLLYMAEKLAKENNLKETIAYRKLIKENDSDLYAAYYDLLKRRKL